MIEGTLRFKRGGDNLGMVQDVGRLEVSRKPQINPNDLHGVLMDIQGYSIHKLKVISKLDPL